jgi:hypothetical protein
MSFANPFDPSCDPTTAGTTCSASYNNDWWTQYGTLFYKYSCSDTVIRDGKPPVFSENRTHHLVLAFLYVPAGIYLFYAFFACNVLCRRKLSGSTSYHNMGSSSDHYTSLDSSSSSSTNPSAPSIWEDSNSTQLQLQQATSSDSSQQPLVASDSSSSSSTSDSSSSTSDEVSQKKDPPGYSESFV